MGNRIFDPNTYLTQTLKVQIIMCESKGSFPLTGIRLLKNYKKTCDIIFLVVFQNNEGFSLRIRCGLAYWKQLSVCRKYNCRCL